MWMATFQLLTASLLQAMRSTDYAAPFISQRSAVVGAFRSSLVLASRKKEHDRDIRLAHTQTSTISEHAHQTSHYPIWNEVKFIVLTSCGYLCVPAVVPFSCCVFYCGHPRFKNFNSAIPVVIRMELLCG